MDKMITSDNGCELRSLLSNSNRRESVTSDQNVGFTYYPIEDGETLQSICLRYACTVAHVKRLNNLMTDQDFYGLKQIKLPLGKFGLLEELLRQRVARQQTDLVSFENSHQTQTRHKSSPGSALSVTTRRTNQTVYEPLISLDYSSDRLDELGRETNSRNNDNEQPDPIRQAPPTISRSSDEALKMSMQHNPHSFSSLRDYPNNDISIAINPANIVSRPNDALRYPKHHIDPGLIPRQAFIKSEFVNDPNLITIDDMLTNEDPNIKNIFEDLDYQVERAKAAAADYEKRSIVNEIDILSEGGNSSRQTTRVSKIPELFFSGENFGLNLKKLLILIFVVCLVVPLVYMQQAHIIM